ncbi:MAG: STAS domain-containing protein [Nocardioides sp.]
MPEASLTVDFDDPVLSVAGEVDEESTETLRLAIEEHSLKYTRGITVDLTGATYVPSIAVGVLVRAGQAFTDNGADFELAAAEGSLAHRVLTVSAMPHRTY